MKSLILHAKRLLVRMRNGDLKLQEPILALSPATLRPSHFPLLHESFLKHLPSGGCPHRSVTLWDSAPVDPGIFARGLPVLPWERRTDCPGSSPEAQIPWHPLDGLQSPFLSQKGLGFNSTSLRPESPFSQQPGPTFLKVSRC